MSLIGIVYPIVTREMLNDLIPNKNYRMIVIAGIGLLALYLVRMGLNYFIQYYGHVMGVNMQAQMRRDMFEHLEKLPYSFYDNHETGKIMSRMTNDLMDVSELAHHGPENLLISTITIAVSFWYLSSINLTLSLMIFCLRAVSCIRHGEAQQEDDRRFHGEQRIGKPHKRRSRKQYFGHKSDKSVYKLRQRRRKI